MHWNRRQMMTAVASAGGLAALGQLALPDGAKAAAPAVNDAGLYIQSWFLDSSRQLGDDLAGAAGSGKRFAVLWEQKNCIYCERLHLINFVKPEIRDYMSANFSVLQLDIHGTRKVTDLDGDVLEERTLARKQGIRYTPTIQFFVETREEAEIALVGDEPTEVLRLPGYLAPDDFLNVLRYVTERASEREGLESFMDRGKS